MLATDSFVIVNIVYPEHTDLHEQTNQGSWCMSIIKSASNRWTDPKVCQQSKTFMPKWIVPLGQDYVPV